MRARGFLTAALIAASAAGAAEDTDGSLARLDAATRSKLDTLLDAALADGPSSRLRELRVARPGIICGMINAKNGFGAYTGYRRFIVDLPQGKAHVAGEDMPPGEADLYAALLGTNCRS